MNKPGRTSRSVMLIFLSFFVLAFTTALSWALPIPTEFRQYLEEKNREDLIEAFERIPTVDPEHFIKYLSGSPIELLGAGFNGAAFKNEQNQVIKILHEVFHFHAEAGGDWYRIRDNVVLSKLIPTIPISERPRSLNEHSIEKELLGNLLWAVYDPEAVKDFPDMVSEDRLAHRRRLVEGTPLKEILVKEANGEKSFDSKALWKQVTLQLNRAEQQLFELGVQIDTLNPANFLVSGSYDKPIVRILDHELIRPSKETYDYYRERGHTIPVAAYTGQRKLVYWPLFPDHIVSSNHWKLTYDQSLAYIRERYGLSGEGAVEYLARVPKLEVDFVPGQTDFSRIERAQRESCHGILTDLLSNRYDKM